MILVITNYTVGKYPFRIIIKKDIHLHYFLK